MLLVLLCVVFAAIMAHQFWWRRKNLPPGPMPWPIFGNTLQFVRAQRWEVVFKKWRDEYGPIYTYWLASKPVVALNTYETIVEYMVKHGDDYADRQAMEHFDRLTRGGVLGIVETSGELWRQQRRFALKTLRDFGLSKSKMEERIFDELHIIIENVNADISSGIDEHDFHKHTDLAVGSLMNAIVCGYRFSSDGRSDEFYKLKHTTEEIMRCFSDIVLAPAFMSDTFMKAPIIRGRVEYIAGKFAVINGFINSVIDQHLAEYDYSSDMEPLDFIDTYLLEQTKQEATGAQSYFTQVGTSSINVKKAVTLFHHKLDNPKFALQRLLCKSCSDKRSTFIIAKEALFYRRQQLVNVVFDLWFAGQETTSSMLTWAIAYLIRHPEAQNALHAELDRVVESDRIITTADRSELPYVNAVINEIMRCANIVGQNLPRQTTRECTLAGFTLAKGTMVIPQISVLAIDPNIYESPEKFDPSRFIDANGVLKRADELLPFSIGKRVCLGESLARMELFIFVANIFNQYTVSLVDTQQAPQQYTLFQFTAGKAPPTLEKQTSGQSFGTKLYTCKVSKRY